MFFLLSTGLLVNKSDLLALYLSGTTVTRPVQDPLAVLLLDNQYGWMDGQAGNQIDLNADGWFNLVQWTSLLAQLQKWVLYF